MFMAVMVIIYEKMFHSFKGKTDCIKLYIQADSANILFLFWANSKKQNIFIAAIVKIVLVINMSNVTTEVFTQNYLCSMSLIILLYTELYLWPVLNDFGCR